jgi:hypothetical protein
MDVNKRGFLTGGALIGVSLAAASAAQSQVPAGVQKAAGRTALS